MKVEVNNKTYQVPEGCTLTNLIEALEIKPLGIAFAVNNKVIKKVDWENFVLTEELKITMIKAVCGG